MGIEFSDDCDGILDRSFLRWVTFGMMATDNMGEHSLEEALLQSSEVWFTVSRVILQFPFQYSIYIYMSYQTATIIVQT